MKKYLLTLLTILSFYQLSAQNLLTNPGFEQYNTCPYLYGQIEYCNDWWNGSRGTPDYYNSCSQQFMGVPVNDNGYQPAYSGNAYVGIVTFAAPPPINWREYIIQALSAPLEIGAIYKLSMKVSLADNVQFASNGIAAYFYTDPLAIDTAHTHQLNVIPQIDYSPYGLITDTANWTTLSDSFVASEAFDHIMIGCFKDDIAVHKLFTNPDAFDLSAYYYIDDVVLEKISNTGINRISTINTTIAPVPMVTVSRLTFHNPQGLEHQLHIFDVHGRSVRRIEGTRKSEILIEREDLNAGCYFYELKNEDGAVAKGKLFVQ